MRTSFIEASISIMFLGAVATAVACSSCAGAGQTVIRQEPAAAACLPMAIPRIVACHTTSSGVAAAEVVCIAVEVAALAACWEGHQPASPPPAPTSTVAFNPDDGAPQVVQLTATVSTPSPIPGGNPSTSVVTMDVDLDVTTDAGEPPTDAASAAFATLWSRVSAAASRPLATNRRPKRAASPAPTVRVWPVAFSTATR
jgi:hypothetical protein